MENMTIFYIQMAHMEEPDLVFHSTTRFPGFENVYMFAED